MELSVNLSAKTLARIYVAVSVLLLAAAVFTSALNRVVRQSAVSDDVKLVVSQGQLRFAPDAEQNIPTWFSSFSLLSCAVVSGLLSLGQRAARERGWLYWAGLSILFLVMSIDEVATLHEFTGRVVELFYHFTGLLEYSWLIVGLPLVVVLAMVYGRWWWRLPPRTRLLFALAAGIFLIGAVVLEMAEGYIEDTYGMNQPATIVLVFLEEFFEALGEAVFIYGLVGYAADFFKSASLNLKFLK